MAATVGVSLAISALEYALRRLGAPLDAARLPSYGPEDNEAATSRLYPNIGQKLYFSTEGFVSQPRVAKADATVSETENLNADFNVAEETEEQRRINKLLQKSRLKNLLIEKDTVVPPPKSKSQASRERREKNGETAGKGWYDLKPPVMTPELEQDLKMIQLRGFVDPKKFFKRQKGEMPKHFEVGKLVNNPLDFYSDGRSKAKSSNQSFVDHLIEDQQYKKYAKKRYRDIQNSRTGLKPKKRKGDHKESNRPSKKLKKF